MKFKIHQLHQKFVDSGLSFYEVANRAGIGSQNTVKRYVAKDGAITGKIEPPLVKILMVFGLSWRDESVVEVIEVEDA